jgi:hypothetical protein
MMGKPENSTGYFEFDSLVVKKLGAVAKVVGASVAITSILTNII